MSIFLALILLSLFILGCHLCKIREPLEDAGHAIFDLQHLLEKLAIQDNKALNALIEALNEVMCKPHIGDKCIVLDSDTITLRYNLKGRLVGMSTRSRTKRDDIYLK